MFLNELKRECEACRRCELCESRNNVVFGVGSENADIMLIGEAPGENEDMQGQPFVGRSGKLLDEMIGEYGLSRDKNIYIANMLKCRPPKNRDPKPSEQNLCIEWLDRQIEIIDPKIIVCVGRIAAQKLIGKDFKVTKQHGEFIEIGGRLYTGTYHPAAILRNINNKPFALDDWKKIRETAERNGLNL